MMGSFKTIELNDTTLQFYEGVVISWVKEDVLFEKEHVAQLLQICKEVFKEKPFVYISERKNNYNVNPTIYFSLKYVKPLVGIAIVSERFETLKIANFEKQFSPVPFDIFSSLAEAQSWAKSLL